MAQSLERQVFGTFGNVATAGNVEISFTAGEPLTRTLAQPNFILTQGFQQPIVVSSEELAFYFPNAFTPFNGDGLNQEFKPIFQEKIDKYSFKVYSRWRVLIFESNDPDKGWDGTYDNLPVPPGLYVYSVELTIDRAGEPFETSSTGVIHLIK